MKITQSIATSIVFSLGVLFFSFLFATVSFAQPKIYFEEPIFDAGDVDQGTDVEHVFMFVNQGMDELIIQKVSTS